MLFLDVSLGFHTGTAPKANNFDTFFYININRTKWITVFKKHAYTYQSRDRSRCRAAFQCILLRPATNFFHVEESNPFQADRKNKIEIAQAGSSEGPER